MTDPMRERQFVVMAQNLQLLANRYRDDRKYPIARALYQRAVEFLKRAPESSQGKQALMAELLENEAVLMRKMNGRSVAPVAEQYAEAVGKR